MRVLMFGWEFPPYISGGLGTACYELSRALTRHGVEVTFVVPRALRGATATPVRLLSAAEVPLTAPATRAMRTSRRLRFRVLDALLRPYLTAPEYAQILKTLENQRAGTGATERSLLELHGGYGSNLMAEVARYSEAAEALARREEFDVIHTHDWLTIPAGLRARRVSGKPLLVHMHALEFDRSGENINRDIYAIEKLGMEAADQVVAVSHYTRQMILDRYGIPPDKVAVVHNAVSRRHAGRVYHVKKRRGTKVVLFLGRITFQKGPDYFVEAAALVLQKLPNVTFVMAGTGDMLPRMISRVAQLRIGQHFHFTGFLQGQEVEQMYALSDLYVMPSVSEPFGISPLEAMLYDVPVIVSRQSGVSEVLTHALKVDFWDVREMANQIIAVLRYPALSRELLRNGRRELQALRWDVAAERIVALYQRLGA